MDSVTALSGIAVGTGFGFVLQRGRFCLNTAFRNAFYLKEFTLLRAYVLALVIALIGATLLTQFGLLRPAGARQEFGWLAGILGGYVFGVGMVLAGGDAGSTWSRTGEGLVGSWMAALGLMIGAAAAGSGVLSGVAGQLQGIAVHPGGALTIPDALGMNRWIVVSVLAVLGTAFLVTGKTFYTTTPGYSWQVTGSLIGLLAVLGLFVSGLMTGSSVGITFPGPSGGLLAFATSSTDGGWGVALVAGVPLGALISAAGLREFSWRAPRADVMAQQFSGGLLMGIGGMLAKGCSIGHGLTGLALLSLMSIVAMAGIVLGSWTMVYLLFMRGGSRK